MSEAGRKEYLQKIKAVEEYEKNVNKEEPNSWGAPTVPSSYGGVPSVGSATYTIPPINTYPEKIILPSGDRSTFNDIAAGYAQSNITNRDVFTTLNPQKFDVHAPTGNPGSGCLRKDFVFYLEELHSIVCPKMGVNKLIITSTFRTQAEQNWEYRNSATVPNSAHMGGVAVDISALGDNRYVIADAAYYMNFGGIAVGSNFIHLDIGPYGRWSYTGTPMYDNPGAKY